ncbi:hypothetical protein RFI_24961, partial [Reticulomyxa filosa]
MASQHTKKGSISALIDLMAGATFTSQQNANQISALSNAEEEKNYEEYKAIEHQIRDTKVSLKNSREKVVQLQKNVKSAKDDKYKSEKQLVEQLQDEQKKLLSTINAVKESKYRLIRSAGVEMDRLRSIIRILQEQVQSIQSGISPYYEGVLPQTITNYMQYNSDATNLKFSLSVCGHIYSKQCNSLWKLFFFVFISFQHTNPIRTCLTRSLGLDNLLQLALNPNIAMTDALAPDFLEKDAGFLF